jgi:hypothetical protein
MVSEMRSNAAHFRNSGAANGRALFQRFAPMKRTNLSFAIAYLLLVALPLVVLTEVLLGGRRLTAPVSVGGLWRIHAASDKVFPLPCGKSIAAAETNLTILQSGKNFTLNFANSTMSSIAGVVEGSFIKAKIVPSSEWAKAAGCNEERSLTLTATVDSAVNARFLSGTLFLSDCPACIPVQFHAIREEQKKSGRGN